MPFQLLDYVGNAFTELNAEFYKQIQNANISLWILFEFFYMQQYIFNKGALQFFTWVNQQQEVEHRLVFPKDTFGPFDV